jgi:hypothetical protein
LQQLQLERQLRNASQSLLQPIQTKANAKKSLEHQTDKESTSAVDERNSETVPPLAKKANNNNKAYFTRIHQEKYQKSKRFPINPQGAPINH